MNGRHHATADTPIADLLGELALVAGYKGVTHRRTLSVLEHTRDIDGTQIRMRVS